MGQHVPRVLSEVTVVRSGSIINPLGQAVPGEKYDDEAQPDGRHFLVLSGPKFPQFEMMPDQAD